jgi:hypothetical protein
MDFAGAKRRNLDRAAVASTCPVAVTADEYAAAPHRRIR